MGGTVRVRFDGSEAAVEDFRAAAERARIEGAMLQIELNSGGQSWWFAFARTAEISLADEESELDRRRDQRLRNLLSELSGDGRLEWRIVPAVDAGGPLP